MTEMTTPRISTTIALCSAIVVSAAALAQDNYGARVEQTQEKMQFTFGAGFEFQFSSNIANGGDMDVYRFDFGLAAKTALNDEWDLRMLVGYELDKYQFAGVTTFGGPDPWDDVHQVSFGGIFTYRPSNEWSLFGGPVFQFAAEESADLSDGFIGGGVFGATYELAEDFTVGGASPAAPAPRPRDGPASNSSTIWGRTGRPPSALPTSSCGSASMIPASRPMASVRSRARPSGSGSATTSTRTPASTSTAAWSSTVS
jgi:hypothetical protein